MFDFSVDEQTRIREFEETYNEIDEHLRETLSLDRQRSFSQVLSSYEATKPAWRDGSTLRRLGDLRNTIVHGRKTTYEYMAVPTHAAVSTIKAVRTRLITPLMAQRVMTSSVRTVSLVDSLMTVLATVAECDFSQFPVLKDNETIGLITENGITRWLAEHLKAAKIELVDFRQATVGDVLAREDVRKTFTFVARHATAAEVDNLFRQNVLLEAVFLTHSGKATEKLLGVATRWDTPLDNT